MFYMVSKRFTLYVINTYAHENNGGNLNDFATNLLIQKRC